MERVSFQTLIFHAWGMTFGKNSDMTPNEIKLSSKKSGFGILPKMCEKSPVETKVSSKSPQETGVKFAQKTNITKFAQKTNITKFKIFGFWLIIAALLAAGAYFLYIYSTFILRGAGIL